MLTLVKAVAVSLSVSCPVNLRAVAVRRAVAKAYYVSRAMRHKVVHSQRLRASSSYYFPG